MDALCPKHARPADICAQCPEEEWSEWDDVPRCPHCGARNDDWWDGAPIDMADGSRFTSTCGRCSRDFEVRVSVSPDFSTRALAA